MIFSATRRPDRSLFFRRNEPGDPRLGETVLHEPADYASADTVLLGCPQDEGVRRNGGRPGAALAPREIRFCLYKLVHVPGTRLFDLGDTRLCPTLEETHDRHHAVVRQLLADGKRVIVLGGGNDLSYPNCSALALAAGPVAAFNIDSHLDVRESAERHSGTPYRQLLDEGHLHPHDFFEIGSQRFAVSPAHLAYLKGLGAHVHSLSDLQHHGLAKTLRSALALTTARSIFWGLDMDAVRAADAPGVSAPCPTGLTARALCRIAAMAGAEPRSRLLEITEVNPAFDIDHATARLAALAIFHFLARQL